MSKHAFFPSVLMVPMTGQHIKCSLIVQEVVMEYKVRLQIT